MGANILYFTVTFNQVIPNIKRSITDIQTIRLSTTYSQENGYKNYCNQIESRCLKCSHPENLIDTERKKIKFKSRAFFAGKINPKG